MLTEMIVIGASAGGVKALAELFSELPNNFLVPIAVAIHRSPVSFDYLIDNLQKYTQVKVQEAQDKILIRPATITVAPANYHLLIDKGHYALSIDDSVNNSRPSIDVLMESAAQAFGPSLIGIILTGGGTDGLKGLNMIKNYGGKVLVQSPETSQDPALPQLILNKKIVSDASSIKELANFINRHQQSS